MNRNHHSVGKQVLALALASTTIGGCALPASASGVIGNHVTPSYDEAYYATLDYYGNLINGSVVKSYTLNGASSLQDHGTYDEVINLTDGTAPVSQDGGPTFAFNEKDAPAHFYFEGKTAAPFEALPWTISVSYTLNGVPTPAEELAGKTGVVEIIMDAVPNENASAYARNNYTLEATAMFNQDDILSLEAEGAQVQLIGNLRVVLFAVLPGETCHRVIRVGADEFSFGGLTLLMAPATLGQLEEISKLSQRKDELEEDYRKLSGSLDTLLSSFSAMGSSLRETANGLDELNEARDTISNGKDQLYADGDKVLDDLKKLNGSLNTLPGHLENTDDAVTDVTESLDDVNDAAVRLQGNLKDLDRCIRNVQADLRNIKTSNGDLHKNLDQLGKDLAALKAAVEKTKGAIKSMDIQINGGLVGALDQKLDQDDTIKQHITVNGSNVKDLKNKLAAGKPMQTAWAFLTKDEHGMISYPAFQQAALIASGSATPETAAAKQAELQQLIASADSKIQAMVMAGTSVEDATKLVLTGIAAAMGQPSDQIKAAYTSGKMMEKAYCAATAGTIESPMSQVQFYVALQMLSEAKAINDRSDLSPEQQNAAIGKVLTDPQKRKQYEENAKILTALKSDHDLATAMEPVAGLLQKLAVLLDHLGENGLTGSLKSTIKNLSAALGSLDGIGDAGRDMLKRLDTILEELDHLNSTINDQVPGLRETIQDTKTLISDMVISVDDTHAFLTSFRSLAQNSGEQLDAGTKKSLEHLAETLRRTANTTDAAGGVKTAKDAVSEIVEDTWHEYTGDINNILLMDPTAKAESLTSPENPAPSSVQILIRTQEIKTNETEAAKSQAADAPSLTFWGRIAKMFKDFWSTLTGFFH